VAPLHAVVWRAGGYPRPCGPEMVKDGAERGVMLASRYIPWVVLVVGVGVAFAYRALAPSRTAADTSRLVSEVGQPLDRGPDHGRGPHYVGPRQLADANGMIQREAGSLSATAQNGERMNWDHLCGGQPLVLIFIKDGCPCNVEVEPFFQRVEKLYAGETRFAGVIDAGTEAAARYATEHGVPHPVLADPEKHLIRQFKAEYGCYVVLLTPRGVIKGCWPGCSADTMRQLGGRIADLAGVKERPLDVSGMPVSLTTGCPFKS